MVFQCPVCRGKVFSITAALHGHFVVEPVDEDDDSVPEGYEWVVTLTDIEDMSPPRSVRCGICGGDLPPHLLSEAVQEAYIRLDG